jgi:transcriptional regulator with XRE-family HTH domain
MRKDAPRRLQRASLAATVGRRIRSFREERGWSSEALATMLSIPAAWVRDYESGVRLPRAYTLHRLAEVFSTSVGALLGDSPPEQALTEQVLLLQFRRIQGLGLQDRKAVSDLLKTLLDSLERARGRAPS